MSNQGEKFCLRWNDFETNISSSFKELKNDEDFFDITLACAGEKQVQAHKVILSACSPFFKSILKKNPHQHPLVYLKGVQYEEVLSVVNFMYHGEVNVAQEDLASFLAVASELQVKGLSQDGAENGNRSIKQTEKSVSPAPKTGEKHDSIDNPPKHQRSQNIYKQIKENVYKQETSRTRVKTEEPVLIDFDPVEEITAEPMLENEDFVADSSGYDYDQDCEDLGQTGLYGDNMSHGPLATDVESQHNFSWKTPWNEKKTVSCDICFKTFKSKGSLTNHLGIHKGLTTCSICQKVFATTSSLNLHMKNCHALSQ